MRSMVAQSLVWGACFVAGLMAPIKPSRAANCALYARAETGVALYGSAGGWWDEADGRYERGHVPAVGAILVFKRTQRIPSGHVAVVSKIISPHEILVDHANWYHGTVSRGMSVIDTSSGHDWSSVAVMDLPSGTHGSDYPTYGFVYPGATSREVVETSGGDGLDPYVTGRSSRSTLFHFAVATEDWQIATTTRRDHRPREVAPHQGHQVSRVHAQNHPAARAKPVSPVRASHVGFTGSRTHPIKMTQAKDHRV
ncbi:MAG: CHAP domain-containing protein [Alphaproteobacteria bacterium]|nr:CHAP domain-containing protein [Alphaproteobacteria bacterium]